MENATLDPDPETACPNLPASEPDPFQPMWDRAREAYLAGDSAPVVAARLGLSERTLQRRAAREGWRRCDRARESAGLTDLGFDLDDPDDPFARFCAITHREAAELLIEPTLAALVRYAFRRSAEAAVANRQAESLGWARLFTLLQRGAERLPVPDRGDTTPDNLRALYAEALRHVWGEAPHPNADL